MVPTKALDRLALLRRTREALERDRRVPMSDYTRQLLERAERTERIRKGMREKIDAEVERRRGHKRRCTTLIWTLIGVGALGVVVLWLTIIWHARGY